MNSNILQNLYIFSGVFSFANSFLYRSYFIDIENLQDESNLIKFARREKLETKIFSINLFLKGENKKFCAPGRVGQPENRFMKNINVR